MLDNNQPPTTDHRPPATDKIGILISGRGSNMTALLDAARDGQLDAEVAVVISNIESAAGLQTARERGVETLFISHKGRSREVHDAEMIQELRRRGVRLVCLAGYMRLVSASFVRAFENRLLNIHPSLLPAFPGLDAQQQALAHGVKITGCTVHLSRPSMDWRKYSAIFKCADIADTAPQVMALILRGRVGIVASINRRAGRLERDRLSRTAVVLQPGRIKQRISVAYIADMIQEPARTGGGVATGFVVTQTVA